MDKVFVEAGGVAVKKLWEGLLLRKLLDKFEEYFVLCWEVCFLSWVT